MVAVGGALVKSGGVGLASGAREAVGEAVVRSGIAMVSAGAVTGAGGVAACCKDDMGGIAMVE